MALYAECHYAECRVFYCYAECRSAEWHSAECHYDEYCYDECRCALERSARYKQSSLLGPFVSYRENKLLSIRPRVNKEFR
jgi:hypothetical protein